MNLNFTNKVVLVTGASSGIGAASAILFAQYGAKLSLVGRNEQRLMKTAEECHKACGNQPLCIKIDLTREGSCATVITKTIATFQKLDVLVNCAAKVAIGSLYDDNLDSLDEMININLRVPYRLTQLAVPYLAKTKGHIINMDSTKSSSVRPGFMPYTVSKAALIRFTKSAANELVTEGIKVNSVQPGLTRTNLMTGLAIGEADMDNTYDGLESQHVVLKPEDVAKMIVFVASGVCPSMTGVEISLDGATTMM